MPYMSFRLCSYEGRKSAETPSSIAQSEYSAVTEIDGTPARVFVVYHENSSRKAALDARLMEFGANFFAPTNGEEQVRHSTEPHRPVSVLCQPGLLSQPTFGFAAEDTEGSPGESSGGTPHGPSRLLAIIHCGSC